MVNFDFFRLQIVMTMKFVIWTHRYISSSCLYPGIYVMCIFGICHVKVFFWELLYFDQTCVCALGYTEDDGSCVSLSTLDCNSTSSIASQVNLYIFCGRFLCGPVYFKVLCLYFPERKYQLR